MSGLIPALLILVGELPQDIRGEQLMTKYWANLTGPDEKHPSTLAAHIEVRSEADNIEQALGGCDKRYAEDLGVINIKLSSTAVIPEAVP